MSHQILQSSEKGPTSENYKREKAIKRREKKECFFARYHPVAQLCCCTTRDHTLWLGESILFKAHFSSNILVIKAVWGQWSHNMNEDRFQENMKGFHDK